MITKEEITQIGEQILIQNFKKVEGNIDIELAKQSDPELHKAILDALFEMYKLGFEFAKMDR